MEKAITEMRNSILQLSNDTLTSNPQEISMNFVAAIIWGNVIYIIKFGDIEEYLMKGGEITKPSMTSEGLFSSYSELLDEDDVFIFCTKGFSSEFPIDRLLSASISEGNLKPTQSCLLMRITKDSEPLKEDDIDLGLGSAVAQSQNRERVDRVTTILKKTSVGASSVIKKILRILEPLVEKIKKLIGKVIPRRKAVLFTRKITQVADAGNKKTKGWLFLSIITVLLSISVFFTFKSKIFREEDVVKDTEITETIPETENTVGVVQEDRSRDEEFKIERVSPEVFYDIKITDTEADPSEIQIIENQLVTVDRTSGKIYLSEISTTNFVAETSAYKGIKSLAQTEDGLLGFNDGETYKTYNLETSELIDSYPMEDLNLTYPYSGYIYSISNDILTRSSEKGGELEGILWGQNPNFKDARSMAIAYTVFVVTNNGELVEYSGGTKTDFSVSGLEDGFKYPIKVVADLDFSNIYVADKGNKSIVVLDEDGNLVKQYKNENAALWEDIRGIAVSEEDNVIFVLDSNKIYKIDTKE